MEVAGGISQLAEWLIRGIGMADEIGTSFSAATLPTDILKPHGGVFVTYEHIVWIAITISIAAVAGFIAWRMLRNHREWREMKESMRAVRAEADRASYQYAKIEKDYERLKRDELRLKGGAEINKVLGTLGYDRGEIMDMLGAQHHPAGTSSPKEPYSASIMPPRFLEPASLPVGSPPPVPPSAQTKDIAGGAAREAGGPREAASLPPVEAPAPLADAALGDVSRWQIETVRVNKGTMLQSNPLYSNYNLWCTERRKKPVSPNVFSMKMEEIGFVKKKVSGKMHWLDVALRPADDNVVKFPGNGAVE